MDTVKRMKIQNLREQIVQDVDIEHIIDYLISKCVVSEDEFELIKQEKTRKDKTRRLLDLLPHKSFEAFDHFVTALENPYPWISSQLKTDGPQTYQVEEKSYFDTLLLGGLPQPPPNNVTRQEKIEDVRSSLSSLKRRCYVVLHGMTGSGKSCLAAAALDNKQLIIEKFNGAVYWLSVGDVGSDDLLCHMTELMEKLSHHPGLGAERLQSSTSVKGARESLRRYFLSDCLREGLLILDDVKSSELIDAFDIGCKILVTTKDSAVMKSVEGRHKLIQVSEGFTEQESLCLFAKCVQVKIPQLPPQAKKIHKLCKGVPMVIALIGAQLAQNRDDVQRNQGRWDYYVDRLTKRDFGIIKRSSFSHENGLLGAIGLCVDNLPPYMKQFYQDFALFVEDVNIKPEVLGILWSRNKYEVEDIMSEFLKKSLAVSKWNELLNSYVYGIHDLLLCYLKMQLTHEDVMALHKRLLDCYTSVCNGNFSKLPNDNYIFSYIGHHLNEAEMWSMFPKLYLDLEFIGAKLKVTGPGDLLVDYKKYSKFITAEDDYRQALLEDFEQFVRTHGLDLHKYQDMDIIQCGLQEPHSSHVYKEALKIAKQRPKKLYLEFLLDQDSVPQPHTLSLKEEVFAACFTAEEKKILIANGSGIINLWETDYARILYKFPGHKQTVVHLELSPDGTQFLSCSEDYTVKLWNLEGAICKNKDQEEFDEHGCALKTPSPRMRQSNWSNMFSNDKDGDRSHLTFTGHENHVLYATYSQNGEEVMSCSKDGSVKVWSCMTGEIRLTFQVPSELCYANRCIFSENESLIFFGGNEKIIYAYENSTGSLVTNFTTSGVVIGIINVTADKIAVVTDNCISIWSWDCGEGADSTTSSQLLIRKKSPDRYKMLNGAHKKDTSNVMLNIKCEQLVQLSNAHYTCATLSQDGRYIIVGASDFSIRLWDVDEHKLVKQYHGHNGWVMCLDTFWGASYQLLLSGSDDKTIKIWHIELGECEAECKCKLQQNFDALWDGKSSDPWVPLLVAPDSHNKLQILRGRSIVTESVPETVKVKTCKITSNGDFVIYGCYDGLVKACDIKKKTSSEIMKLNGAVHYLQLCYNNGLIIIAAGEDHSLKIRRGTLSEIGSVVSCAGQTDKVVQCFLISMGQKLLSCAQDGSVKIWETGTGNLIDVLLGRYTETHVTMADLSASEDLLVLCDASGYFFVTHLEGTSFPPYLTTKGSQTFNMNDSLRSCKLSHDARLLALGQDNGNIIIWDVRNELVLKTLKLHKNWVRNLLFAPLLSMDPGATAVSMPPIILVSVADQIGWWDLSRLSAASCTQRRRMSSGQRRRRRSGDSPKLALKLDGSISDPMKCGCLADEWVGKEGPAEKPELLGCVKLVGRQAKKISASKDFTAFATVDGSGIVYLMKVLK